MQGILKFAPRRCNIHDGTDVPKCEELMRKYEEARDEKDVPAIKALLPECDKLSRAICFHCRDIEHNSEFHEENNMQAAMRRMLEALRVRTSSRNVSSAIRPVRSSSTTERTRS